MERDVFLDQLKSLFKGQRFAGKTRWDGVEGTPTFLMQIFYQSSAPSSGMSDGDFWIDSDDNKIYRYAASSWGEVQDDQIAAAISDAATAQSTADGKVVTFIQAAAPTAEGTGDIWFDSDDNNKPYRWSGSAWVAAEFDVATWANILGLDNSTPEIAESRFNTLFRRYVFIGNNNDGLTELINGTGSITRNLIVSILEASTGDGAGDAELRSINTDLNFADYTIEMVGFFKSEITAGSPTAYEDVFILASSGGQRAVNNGDHFGFVTDDGTLYASSANGSTQERTEITGITISNLNSYRAVFTPGSNVKFYVNDVLKATHTTYIPNSGVVLLSFFTFTFVAGGGSGRTMTISNNYSIMAS